MPPERFGELIAGLPARDAMAAIVPLDWHGLVARLAAADAARRILDLPPPRRCGPDCGSFAPDTARDIARWRARPPSSSSGVNLDAKAAGKPWWTIAADSAGDDRFVVRGRL